VQAVLGPVDPVLENPELAVIEAVAVEHAELVANVADLAAQAPGFALGDAIAEVVAVDALLEHGDLVADCFGAGRRLVVAPVAAVIVAVAAVRLGRGSARRAERGDGGEGRDDDLGELVHDLLLLGSNCRTVFCRRP
jgi:hypothetical protein